MPEICWRPLWTGGTQDTDGGEVSYREPTFWASSSKCQEIGFYSPWLHQIRTVLSAKNETFTLHSRVCLKDFALKTALFVQHQTVFRLGFYIALFMRSSPARSLEDFDLEMKCCGAVWRPHCREGLFLEILTSKPSRNRCATWNRHWRVKVISFSRERTEPPWECRSAGLDVVWLWPIPRNFFK